MTLSNSSLVDFIKFSPNMNSPRNHKIDTITIHCVVGQVTAESLGDWFSKESTWASSNYGVDKDGRIGMYVEERNRSWCTSSGENDHRAITIEVASDTEAPYAVTDKAYEALINLLVDICKRNPGIKKLRWKGDNSLIGKVDKQNMTVHKWFANTDCPGEYLYSRHGDIANKVNAILEKDTNLAPTNPSSVEHKKVAYAKSKNNSLAGRYVVTALEGLNLRYTPGVLTKDNVITAIPRGAVVQNYGYFTKIDGVRWLYIAYRDMVGFIHSDYVKKF